MPAEPRRRFATGVQPHHREQRDEIERHDPQRTLPIEPAEEFPRPLAAEDDRGDEVAAQREEEFDAAPSEGPRPRKDVVEHDGERRQAAKSVEFWNTSQEAPPVPE